MSPAAVTLETFPKRVSSRKQRKVTSTSVHPEIIVIPEESEEFSHDVSQNVFENVPQNPFVIPREVQTETVEFEEAQHGSGNERGMPSLDDLAEAARQVSEETQSPPEQQHESILKQEEEQLEQFEVSNETPLPPETC